MIPPRRKRSPAGPILVLTVILFFLLAGFHLFARLLGGDWGVVWRALAIWAALVAGISLLEGKNTRKTTALLTVYAPFTIIPGVALLILVIRLVEAVSARF